MEVSGISLQLFLKNKLCVDIETNQLPAALNSNYDVFFCVIFLFCFLVFFYIKIEQSYLS